MLTAEREIVSLGRACQELNIDRDVFLAVATQLKVRAAEIIDRVPFVYRADIARIRRHLQRRKK